MIVNESILPFVSHHFLTWVICVFAFALGSVPFGLLVARLFKVKDLTRKGSGNIGATNVARVIGFWPAGFLTFLLDMSKGVLATVLATPVGYHLLVSLLGSPSDVSDSAGLSIVVPWIAGFFVVLGHCYSPWLHLKGGKGVATGLGVILVLSPLSALFGILAFGLVFFHSRIASLSSIAGLILAAIAHLVFNPVGVHLCVGLLMLLVILIRHEANIDALLENREKSFN
jgi:glycerol-3-phosphate acyltransferase PlsY